jgi:hypothetical protein
MPAGSALSAWCLWQLLRSGFAHFTVWWGSALVHGRHCGIGIHTEASSTPVILGRKDPQLYMTKPHQYSYYREFLDKLFWRLATAPGSAARFSGIPFLNGGLFDDDEFLQAPNRKTNPPQESEIRRCGTFLANSSKRSISRLPTPPIPLP